MSISTEERARMIAAAPTADDPCGWSNCRHGDGRPHELFVLERVLGTARWRARVETHWNARLGPIGTLGLNGNQRYFTSLARAWRYLAKRSMQRSDTPSTKEVLIRGYGCVTRVVWEDEFPALPPDLPTGNWADDADEFRPKPQL